MGSRALVKFNIIFLLGVFLISLIAYLIIPDHTNNANDQQLSIALKKPFFSTKQLAIKSNVVKQSKSFISSVISGFEKKQEHIPFRSIEVTDQSIKLTSHINRTQIIQPANLARPATLEDNISTKTYWLGTDKFGRCILSRLVLGIRISIFIGFVAVLISLLIGITLGSLAGYYGGWIDRIISYFISVTWSIPTLLMVFIIVLALGRGLSVIFLAIGLTMWVDVARIVRGQVLSIREQAYIKATKVLSISDVQVIWRHILPNLMSSVLVIAASNFAIAILVEAGLSYLGFGIQPPAPSLGNMLYENYGYAISGKVYLAIIPAITIMLLVLSFNLLGTGLRDILDVKAKKSE